jgi:DnaJ like chaperone protein
MNYWGKIIGFGTGLALGGVEGSLVGAIAGHAVDIYTSWAEQHVAPAAGGPGSERRNAGSRYNFTLAIVTLGAKLAKADGPVVKAEIAAFKDVFRVPAEEARNVGQMFDRARVSPLGYEPYAEQLAVMFEDNHAMLDEVIGCLFHVAIADGAIRPEEAEFIRRVTRIFGFSDSYFQRKLEELTGYTYGARQDYGARPGDRAREQAHASQTFRGRQQQQNARQDPPPRRADPASDPYAILGVTATMADKDIKLKYRRLVRENHPDSLVAAGKSKEAVAQATAKLARINAAYDQINKERHIS